MHTHNFQLLTAPEGQFPKCIRDPFHIICISEYSVRSDIHIFIHIYDPLLVSTQNIFLAYSPPATPASFTCFNNFCVSVRSSSSSSLSAISVISGEIDLAVVITGRRRTLLEVAVSSLLRVRIPYTCVGERDDDTGRLTLLMASGDRVVKAMATSGRLRIFNRRIAIIVLFIFLFCKNDIRYSNYKFLRFLSPTKLTGGVGI